MLYAFFLLPSVYYAGAVIIKLQNYKNIVYCTNVKFVQYYSILIDS